jgi:hypothetical protein
VALVGDGKAIVGQLNQALAGRQWFYPKDTGASNQAMSERMQRALETPAA